MQNLERVPDNATQVPGSRFRWTPIRVALIVVGLALVLALTTLVVQASVPLGLEGYADFSYGGEITEEPTAKEPQSKAWWNDNNWWAVLYNTEAGAYHIYRLDATGQEWIDTGVAADDREDSRADALWDDGEQTLYIASHRKRENPGTNTNPDNWARLYRYSYDADSDTYALDSGYPVTINDSVVESLALDKDSQGRLWITYATRDTQASPDVYEVYVNYTTNVDNDTSWATPYALPFPEATVDIDDISALVAFQDAEGGKVGVMWSNQTEGHNRFYFATRSDTDDPGPGSWELDGNFTSAITAKADDHINFASLPTGELFAVIKTGADPQTEPMETLIGVVTREANGTYGFVEVSPAASRDTSPLILAHASGNEVYVFTSTKTDGGAICIHTAAVTDNLADMSFPGDNCPAPPGQPDELLAAMFALQDVPYFIADNQTYFFINNPTSTKQTVSDESGIMVLANDEPTRYYVHNHVGGDTVPPTPDPTPDPDTSETLHLPVIFKNAGGQQ